MRTRWINRLAWGGLGLSLLIGLVNTELLGFHWAEALLYGVLLFLLSRESKISLLFGVALGSIWLLIHIGLTRWVVTSAFSLWINWEIALETNPGGPLSILLAFLNFGLTSDCFYDYLKRSDKTWLDLKIFVGLIALSAFSYFLIFWIFQPYWLNALLTFGIF